MRESYDCTPYDVLQTKRSTSISHFAKKNSGPDAFPVSLLKYYTYIKCIDVDVGLTFSLDYKCSVGCIFKHWISAVYI